MYWPIGAPRIYAASKHDLSSTFDDDHVPDAQQVGLESSLNGNSVTREEGEPALDDSSVEAPKHTRQSTPTSSGGKQQHTKKLQGNENGSTHIEQELHPGGEILTMRLCRSGHFFATITKSTLTIWQTKPTAAVASILRSAQSLETYGPNIDLLLRPDSAVVVLQTAAGYLITYSLTTDASSRMYQALFPENVSGRARRRSLLGGPDGDSADPFAGPGEGYGVREVNIRFRMVIKVDAGISKALALDDELVFATEKPPAIQCVPWTPDNTASQAATELLKSMSWISKKTRLVDMVHDRPMNISTWITSDGKAYAVQRSTPTVEEDDSHSSQKLFTGHCFHVPEGDGDVAVKAAISARFSLIAIGCADGKVQVYTAKDYAGHIPPSHTLPPPMPSSNTGRITFMTFSPDGYCLFVGYENGWTMWSVYGKPGATSFTSDRSIAENSGESWLTGVKDGFWIGAGSQLLLLGQHDNRLWVLDVARSAVAGCFSSANVARTLLQTPAGFMIYRGYELPDIGAISLDSGLWNHVRIPSTYLSRQWPIRSAVISTDGRYVAVAGRRGLAHYSVNSGRWKTFDDVNMEDEFTVRGSMCWHHHVLIVAVESSGGFQIRIYSRETALDNDNILHTEQLPAPIVLLAPSGQDSLLVYTYENNLHHYVINASQSSVKLVLVGQIALHGIIRAPPRVRALSWILPEDQLENGDPSQDVAIATILFLVDGKLVVLQPTTKENGDMKYDMRIVAQNIEYYALMRDQQHFDGLNQKPIPSTISDASNDSSIPTYHQNDLRDSLWYFDGTDVRVWTDTQDLLATTHPDLGRDLPVAVKVLVDFYPLSVILSRGILFGVEPDIIQRRDVSFSVLRFLTRTQLFLPPVLRHHLAQYNAPSALYLSRHYQHLEYFPHALEVLLHGVLDEEAEISPPPDRALLPSVLSFLSSFPQFLDIVVQCTRKTEVRSWQTLFAHLPPPKELFEESLQKGSLKTAAGYLLVLHTLDELESSDTQIQRLLQKAKDEGDWELCKELARFLMALDDSGETLKEALQVVRLTPSQWKDRGKSDQVEQDTAKVKLPALDQSNGVDSKIEDGQKSKSSVNEDVNGANNTRN